MLTFLFILLQLAIIGGLGFFLLMPVMDLRYYRSVQTDNPRMFAVEYGNHYLQDAWFRIFGWGAGIVLASMLLWAVYAVIIN